MGIDKREYKRLVEEFPVRFEVVPAALPMPVAKPSRSGIAENVSGGGLYLTVKGLSARAVKKLLEQYFKLSLEFYLPDFQNRVKVLGEVRWCREKPSWWRIWNRTWALGVRFTYIQSEDRDCIIKYIINKEIEEHLVEKGNQ